MPGAGWGAIVRKRGGQRALDAGKGLGYHRVPVDHVQGSGTRDPSEPHRGCVAHPGKAPQGEYF
jgi:hypothetical protein